MAKHSPLPPVNKLVETLLDGVTPETTAKKTDPWGLAVKKAEAEGEESDAMHFIDLIAEIYNGGVQQVIEHKKVRLITSAMTFLSYTRAPEAKALSAILGTARRTISEAASKYEEIIRRQRHGEGVDEGDDDPFSQYEETFGQVEDWIYKNENLHPILLAYVGQA